MESDEEWFCHLKVSERKECMFMHPHAHTHTPLFHKPSLARPIFLQEGSSQFVTFLFTFQTQSVFFLFLRPTTTACRLLRLVVWWQATKRIPNICNTSEAPEPNCKLEMHSWLHHQQRRLLVCDSTHHPS